MAIQPTPHCKKQILTYRLIKKVSIQGNLASLSVKAWGCKQNKGEGLKKEKMEEK